MTLDLEASDRRSLEKEHEVQQKDFFFFLYLRRFNALGDIMAVSARLHVFPDFRYRGVRKKSPERRFQSHNLVPKQQPRGHIIDTLKCSNLTYVFRKMRIPAHSALLRLQFYFQIIWRFWFQAGICTGRIANDNRCMSDTTGKVG